MEGLRKALDNLMGKDRDLPLHEQLIRKKHFDDPDVCKFFLIGFCPHEFFINVKSDIGSCEKRHDQHFKIAFENDPHKEDYQIKYEESLIKFLEKKTAKIDQKMKRCLERIEAPVPEQVINPEIQEKIENLDKKITELISEAENLGENGFIDESEKLTKEAEQLKIQRNLLTNSTKDHPAIYKEKQMKVCEICGALQSVQDNEKRIQTHKEGKIHSGYLKIRQYLDLLKKKKIERKIKAEEMKQKEKLLRELKQKEKNYDNERKKILENKKNDKYKRSDVKSKSGSSATINLKNYNNNKYNVEDNNDKNVEKNFDENNNDRKFKYEKSRSREKSRSKDNRKYDRSRHHHYHESKYRDNRDKVRDNRERDNRDNRDRDNKDRDNRNNRDYRDRDRDRENRDEKIRDRENRDRDRDREIRDIKEKYATYKY